MQGYTIKEVSKKIHASPGLIKQWEKELEGIYEIPRSNQGARIYSDEIITLLLEIKQMMARKATREMLREWRQAKLTPPQAYTDMELVPESVTPIPLEETAIKKADDFFEAMDVYKQTFLTEVKEEIRNVVRKEVLEEVKKEIKNGTYYTVKSISDSIYKSSATAQEEIQELTETLEKSSDQTAKSLQYLSKSIANVSMETADEIYALSQQFSIASEEISQFVHQTNNEISSLTEALAIDREYFMDEREQYRHDIKEREAAFQNMLTGFRDAAAAKEKKWWKFWES